MEKNYEYAHAGYDATELKVAPSSMQEMASILSLIKSEIMEEDKIIAKMHNVLIECAEKLEYDDYFNHTAAFDTYMENEAIDREHHRKYDLLTTARIGVEGAMRYYCAKELNDIFREVLPKYTGRKAGLKTKEKFWLEVSERLSVPNLRAYYAGYCTVQIASTSMWSNTIKLMSSDKLVVDDNRFAETFEVHVPKDAFEGVYPVDWMAWAEHVEKANLFLKDEFSAFLRMQNQLINSLKIGDVSMLTVYSYDQKERA